METGRIDAALPAVVTFARMHPGSRVTAGDWDVQGMSGEFGNRPYRSRARPPVRLETLKVRLAPPDSAW